MRRPMLVALDSVNLIFHHCTILLLFHTQSSQEFWKEMWPSKSNLQWAAFLQTWAESVPVWEVQLKVERAEGKKHNKKCGGRWPLIAADSEWQAWWWKRTEMEGRQSGSQYHCGWVWAIVSRLLGIFNHKMYSECSCPPYLTHLGSLQSHNSQNPKRSLAD